MDEIADLRERAKELRCLYEVEAVLESRSTTASRAFMGIAEALPRGWRWSERTGARILYLGRAFQDEFDPQATCRSHPIRVGNVEVGSVDISVRAPGDAPAFLPDELTSMARVAARLGEYLERRHSELLGFALRPEAMHWSWRQSYAEAIARHLDMARFGIDAVYLGGSTEAGTAVSASDVDLYLLGGEDHDSRKELEAWLDGWSLALAEMAHRKTGVAFNGGLLNVSWLSTRPSPGRMDLRCLRERDGGTGDEAGASG